MSRTDKVGSTATTVWTDGESGTVTYRQTKVVTWTPEEIRLDTGGYRTVTTKRRMNQAAVEYRLGFAVFQKNWEWEVHYRGKVYPYRNAVLILSTAGAREPSGFQVTGTDSPLSV